MIFAYDDIDTIVLKYITASIGLLIIIAGIYKIFKTFKKMLNSPREIKRNLTLLILSTSYFTATSVYYMIKLNRPVFHSIFFVFIIAVLALIASLLAIYSLNILFLKLFKKRCFE